MKNFKGLLVGSMVFALFVSVGGAEALTGLPEGGTGATPEINALLDKAGPGVDKIRIDDMVFDVATLAKSGYTGEPWPDGVVFYQFDDPVSSYRRSQWRLAASYLSQAANLTFIEDSGLGHIFVYNDDSNHSQVGWQGIGSVDMGIVSWDAPYIIAHEICHALGFVHEQSRPDRDTYVTINLQNITLGEFHNFEIRDAVTYGEYDFDSLMHYGECDFHWDFMDCPPNYTITVNEPWTATWQTGIGQRDYLSDGDILGLGAVYGASCHGPIYVNPNTIFAGNGGYTFPFGSLIEALAYACPGAEIRIIGGSHAVAPLTILQQVFITSYAGSAVLH